MIEKSVAVVVIGRNEGERLRAALRSTSSFEVRIYVDSGSTDGSQELARKLGFEVLYLDTGSGFTAAKARNKGIFYVAEAHPDIEYLQTIDGDCEFVADWLPAAKATLEAEKDLAVVFGRRRERLPHRNIYHIACELEWQVPEGDVASCGGDALFRMSMLNAVGGYNSSLIAGEEPDLCYRFRKRGWRVRSDGRDMTLHDVDIVAFRQWWQRAKRAGYGIAELFAIHSAAGPDPSWRKFLVSALLWSGVLLGAMLSLIAGLIMPKTSLLVVGGALTILILVQVSRVAYRARPRLPSVSAAHRWSALLLTSKLAQAQGAARFLLRRGRSTVPTLIEYK